MEKIPSSTETNLSEATQEALLVSVYEQSLKVMTREELRERADELAYDDTARVKLLETAQSYFDRLDPVERVELLSDIQERLYS